MSRKDCGPAERLLMRAVRSALAELCADRHRPNREVVDQANPAVEACCRKRRREDINFLHLGSLAWVRI
jgi:hypothetical protein